MKQSVLCALVVSTLLFGGCSDDDSPGGSSGTSGTPAPPGAPPGTPGTPPASGAGTLRGTFSGKGEGGALEVSLPSGTTTLGVRPLANGPQAVTGTLYLSGGSSVPITGTYDADTKKLAVSGGGYTFDATAADGSIDGTYTGPKGNGGFSIALGDVTLYCGTYAGDSEGTWNFAVIGGTTVRGAIVESSGKVGTITGDITVGTTLSIATSFGMAGYGNADGKTGSGTWKHFQAGTEGTFTTTAGCGR